MNPATLSVAALLLVIAVSLSSRINVGILAIACAWLIAVFAAHWKAEALMAVFPSSLFLTLVGVTLLFAVAQRNGTMEGVTHRAVALCGGRSLLLLPMFFVLACAVSTVGPGAIAATALVAPLAMSVASTAGISAFLAALMVGNGANAGNLSPFSAVGVIVQSMMEQAGLGGHEWNVWAANFTAHGMGHAFLLTTTGIVTAVPLICFGAAAVRVSMVSLGLLQYLAPILQFALGVLWFHEEMPAGRWAGFVLVWLALAIFTGEAIRAHRRRQLRLTAEAAAL